MSSNCMSVEAWSKMPNIYLKIFNKTSIYFQLRQSAWRLLKVKINGGNCSKTKYFTVAMFL